MNVFYVIYLLLKKSKLKVVLIMIRNGSDRISDLPYGKKNCRFHALYFGMLSQLQHRI